MEYRNEKWLRKMFEKYKTPTEVSNISGYPRTCITRYALKYKIYEPKYKRKASNEIDEKYFETIDSAEKAYFLGFIMADGNIYIKKDNKLCFSIKIKESDQDIIYKFAQHVNFNKEKIKHGSSKRGNTICNYVQIRTYNQTFCENLLRHGISARKSGQEFIPICNGYEKDFLRGFLDGDGWIGKTRYVIGFCSSSLKIMEDIKLFFEAKGIPININMSSGIYNINIYKLNYIYKILDFIYYEDCISLNRKQILAEKMKNEIYNILVGPL